MAKSSFRSIACGQRPAQAWRMAPLPRAVGVLAALAAMAAPPASAQQATEKLDSVVVTGSFSRSVQNSIDTKKNADAIVEVVTAEDIGKLPDVSIAESLARLPGVAAQRVDGRAQVLSIRGMAPKFGVTLLNGREMVSTGDDRSFEYDQFPSELVTSAAIYKTPDASLGTQGLAGTVNMTTLHPLDHGSRRVNLNARLDRNSYGELVPGSKAQGMRLSASYVDQFANRTIGVALGVAHLDSPNQKKYFNPWDFGKAGDISVDGAGNAYTFNGLETGVSSTQTRRDGVLAVLEFKPGNGLHSQLDLFSSRFSQRMNGRELVAYWANWSNGTTPTFTPLPDATQGGQVGNLTPFVTERKNDRDDRVRALGWNTELKLADWTGQLDLSSSHAKRAEHIGEAYVTGSTPITLDVRMPGDFHHFGTLSTAFDYGKASNFILSTPWWGGGAYASQAQVADDVKSLRLSARRSLDWGPVSGFEGGLIHSRRSKTLDYVGTNYDLKSGTDYDGTTCMIWPVCGGPIPASVVQSPAQLSFVGLPGLVSFDVFDAINSGAYVASPNDPKSPTWNWGIKEKVTTSFAKFNLDFNAGVPVRGNVGVQAVSVRQTADGLYQDSTGALNPITDGTSYTDVLPSLNLIAELRPNTLLRFGAARTVARPNMADMRAGLTASVSQTDRTWSGDGGNPRLKPWRADAFDLSLEHYYGKGSYIAVAAFEKRILTGIVTQSVAYDFSGIPNPSGITPTSNIGTLTTPTNTSGGRIGGVELSGALAGARVSPLLEGFGLLASYSRTHSNLPGTDAHGAVTDTPLEGLSGTVYGLTAYYERAGFEFRVAQRYRSAFTAARHNAFRFVMDSIRPERITDLQLGYNFQDGALKGLGLLLQVNNLTDTPYVVTQTVDGITALKEFHKFGRQLLLGASYKF